MYVQAVANYGCLVYDPIACPVPYKTFFDDRLVDINDYLPGRRRKTRCIYSPGDRECILCKSRGARCIEQGSEDPRVSESKRSNLRKQSANGREPESQAGTSVDQPEKLFEDAESSDLMLSDKIDSAPIVSLLLDAKVTWIIGNLRFYCPQLLTLYIAF